LIMPSNKGLAGARPLCLFAMPLPNRCACDLTDTNNISGCCQKRIPEQNKDAQEMHFSLSPPWKNVLACINKGPYPWRHMNMCQQVTDMTACDIHCYPNCIQQTGKTGGVQVSMDVHPSNNHIVA